MSEVPDNIFSATFADRDVERVILSAMMRDKSESSFFLDRLVVDDFYYRLHREIYSEMCDTYKLGGDLDYITIKSNFSNQQRHQEILEEIQDYAYEQPIPNEQACKLLKEFSSKRLISSLCAKAQNSLNDNSDSSAVISLLQQESTEILRSRDFLFNESCISEADEWIGEIQEEMNLGERKVNDYDGPATGMPLLDLKMHGLQDINVISAPTGHGKSMLALNWVVHIASNGYDGRVLYINYEMNRKQLARRILAMASGVTYDEIYNRKFRSKENVKAYNDARLGLLERKNLIITGNEPKTLGTTMALIQEHATCNNVRVVVIDHLGEIASERDEYNMEHWIKLQKYVKELKNVTTRLGIHLIVVAQQNREGYNNGLGSAGGLGRVAGTLELSRICDCFINMYTTREGESIVSLEKNRNGEACKFKSNFDGARQRITLEGII